MRIPPYYHSPVLRQLLACIITGGIVGFLVCLFLLGESEEHHLHKIREQDVIIQSLEKERTLLLKEQLENNQALEKKMTIQSILVHVTAKKPLLIDRLIKLELERQMTDELSSLINNDLSSVAENRDLIYKTIENHTFIINNVPYICRIQNLIIYTDCVIDVEVTSNR